MHNPGRTILRLLSRSHDILYSTCNKNLLSHCIHDCTDNPIWNFLCFKAQRTHIAAQTPIPPHKPQHLTCPCCQVLVVQPLHSQGLLTLDWASQSTPQQGPLAQKSTCPYLPATQWAMTQGEDCRWAAGETTSKHCREIPGAMRWGINPYPRGGYSLCDGWYICAAVLTPFFHFGRIEHDLFGVFFLIHQHKNDLLSTNPRKIRSFWPQNTIFPTIFLGPIFSGPRHTPSNFRTEYPPRAPIMLNLFQKIQK